MTNGTDPKPSGTWTHIAIFGAIAATFIFILLSIFFPYLLSPSKDPPLLLALAQTDTARGLITFLVAVSTVAIALVVVAYVAVTSDTDLKDRFGYTKDIMTALIGILGTIVGFYFGVAQLPAAGTEKQLALADFRIIPSKPERGAMVHVHATLSGGKTPYSYIIRFTPDTMKEVSGNSRDGKIDHEVKFEPYDPTKPLDITLQATDAAGAIIGNRLHLSATPQAATQTPVTSQEKPSQ